MKNEPMEAFVESVQVGRCQQFAGSEQLKSWTSAIVKTSIDGSVSVGSNGLQGDEQADLKNHGGPEKAVLAYASSHYEAWRAELPSAGFRHGGFGENLTISGITEEDCCIGDVFQIAECLLQITQPRQPCWKLSRRWNIDDLARRVQQTGRTGWYLKVLREGCVAAGAAVLLIERPHPEMSVAWANAVMYAKPRRLNDERQLAACPELSEEWKSVLNQRGDSNL